MDELLKALKTGNSFNINILAIDLFLTKQGKPNKPQIDEFEHYAPCKIKPIENNSLGVIIYNGKSYFFG